MSRSCPKEDRNLLNWMSTTENVPQQYTISEFITTRKIKLSRYCPQFDLEKVLYSFKLERMNAWAVD